MPSSRSRRKIVNSSEAISLPSVSLLPGSLASSEATTAQRSILVAAWVRYWKKLTSRLRQAGSSPTFSRAYIRTSSIRIKVARSSFSGIASRSTSRFSAGASRARRPEPVGMEQPQALGPGDLERQHAPGVPQPAGLARRALDLHPLLGVELVERQGGDPGPGRGHADVLDELVDGGQVGQVRRVAGPGAAA